MPTGTTVRLLRISEHLSQTSLAKKLGISRSYLCRIEKEAKEPSLALIKRLARVFGVPVALLIADKTEVATQLSGDLREIFTSFLAAKINASGAQSQCAERSQCV
jgi:transcriptional regulator with XRE-family HTH domain